MPDISLRAEHQHSYTTNLTASHQGTAPVYRPPARSLLEAVATWIAELLEVEVSSGSAFCARCLELHDGDHLACYYTALCLDCDRRTVVRSGRCSSCGGRQYVATRRGE